PGVLVGMLVFTGAFFAAHSSASGWVSAMADEHRAEASSLYLFGYYTGSSVVGALVGLPFSRSGWAGASLFVGALVVLAALIAAWLVAVTRRTQAAATPGAS
ncbi:MAG: MFS transporter, partial [Dermacoccus nishinomiyaensis]